MPSPLIFATIFAVNVPFVGVSATAAPVKCAAPKACALFENTSTGPALQALSTGGAGAFGATASGSYLEPGIEGESDAVTGSDAAAAFGLNFFTDGVPPTYGVLAYGAQNGLYGATENNGQSQGTAAGVFGQDDGVASYPDYNAGVLGLSSAGTGVLAEVNGTPEMYSGFGYEPIGLYSVANGSDSGGAIGTFAQSNQLALLASNTSIGYEEQVQLAGAIPEGNGTRYGFLIEGQTFYSMTGSGYYFTVDSYGNVDTTGTVASSQPAIRTAGASGTKRIAYASREASPEIEDVGDGQLTDGRAYVTIDPALADSIDMRRPYHVFVTPEGDCNQLYVTQKTAGGFFVRESHGGRSTLAFDYRIVGKPFNGNGARLALAHDATPRTGRRFGHDRAHPPARLLSPADRLRSRLGTQGYAQALFAKRTNEEALR